jgi:hypothetical protein
VGKDRSRPHELVAGEPANQPLQFQDAEGGHDLRRGQPRAGDQLVDSDGVVVELAQKRAFLVVERQFGGMADGGGSSGAV